jgi:hypothetical protein
MIAVIMSDSWSYAVEIDVMWLVVEVKNSIIWNCNSLAF